MTARRGSGNLAGLAVLCLVLLAPLLMVDVPPLLDYPNHLARLFVLARGGSDPILAAFYRPHWAIIPNLGLDLLVPPLIRVFPVRDVGRAVAGGVLLLPVLGAVAYHRALSGRMSLVPLTAVLFAYNGAFLRGFLNFIAALGLALLFAAAWVAWRDRAPVRAVLSAVAGAVVLFFCHLTGLVFFAVLLGAHEAAWLHTHRPPMRAIAVRALVCAIVFLPPLTLYALSGLHHMEGAAVFRSAADKAVAAVQPVVNYLWPLDVATALLAVGVPLLSLARRWCVVPFQSGLALLALLALFLGLPTAFKGTFDLDTRFIVMAAMLLPAALIPAAPPRWVSLGFGVGFAALFAARMGVLLVLWHGWAGDVARFRAVIAPVRPGDVVLTVRPTHPPAGVSAHRLSDGAEVDTHLPALLVIEHRAWWPFLFDNESQQPIETREPFRSLAGLIDASPDPAGLVARDPAGTALVTHVLVMGGAADDPPGCRLLTRDPSAALFAVTRLPGPPPGR